MSPFFYAVARVKARKELHIAGHSRSEVNRIMDGCDNDIIDAAVQESGVKLAIGDGPIIAAILAFFESAQGQALIAALVKLLLSVLAV